MVFLIIIIIIIIIPIKTIVISSSNSSKRTGLEKCCLNWANGRAPLRSYSHFFLLQPRGAVKPSDGHFGVGCDVYEVRPTPHSATIKPLQNPHTSAEEHSIGSWRWNINYKRAPPQSLLFLNRNRLNNSAVQVHCLLLRNEIRTPSYCEQVLA